MHYPVYRTKGYILDSLGSGEGSKCYFIFTKDLGLIRVYAQSVRNTASKLRPNLEGMYFSKIELIKGREIWRIKDSFIEDSLDKNHSAYMRIAKMISRFSPSDEKNEELFSELAIFFNFLKKDQLSPFEEDMAILVFLSKALCILGYLDKSKIRWMENREMSKTYLNDMRPNARELLKEINSSMEHSHL